MRALAAQRRRCRLRPPPRLAPPRNLSDDLSDDPPRSDSADGDAAASSVSVPPCAPGVPTPASAIAGASSLTKPNKNRIPANATRVTTPIHMYCSSSQVGILIQRQIPDSGRKRVGAQSMNDVVAATASNAAPASLRLS